MTKRKLERALAGARDYDQWREIAEQIDRRSGAMRWREVDQSNQYDYLSIRSRLERLRDLRTRDDYSGLLFTLNEGIHGNMGGMGNAALYTRALSGTKHLIEAYIGEVSDALELLAGLDDSQIDVEEKSDFFRRADQCFGHSALMMSGSGALLYFHAGVVKCLWQHRLLPQVLSGSSGGAIVGSLLATHSDEELEGVFDPDYLASAVEHTKGFLGALGFRPPRVLKPEEVRARIDHFIPDLTFQESFERSGRLINISIAPAETHQTSRLLNATSSPNVLIREALMASTAVPGIYPSVMLLARDKYGDKKPYLPSRKWVDGAVSDDLPAKRLARLYGVNHFVVSQTNPHVIPFIGDAKRQSKALPVLRVAATRTAREWLNAGATLLQKPLSRSPAIHQLLNTTLAVVNQDYVGDINVLPPFRFRNPMRLLDSLSVGEIDDLIGIGERATWPKLEMVRLQTQISRTLRRIRDTSDLIESPGYRRAG
ncbi:DUF3336 domain-containing protein [Luminiphilus syltensis]|nr:DUF3336 domain-containing protein [Luminiphilus syltensis]